MRPLPARPYEYAEWKQVRVNIDYRVDIDRHYYSVPYQLLKQQLDARITARTVELLHKGRRVASHPRSHRVGHTTAPEHMPSAHRAYAEWTPQRLVRWAAQNGPFTAALIQRILVTRVHSQQGFRSCLGIMRLGQTLREQAPGSRLPAGAGARRTRLQERRGDLEERPGPQPLPPATPEPPKIEHHNLRGPDYYH